MRSSVLFDLVRERASGMLSQYKLRACTSVGCSPRVRGRLWIHGDGEIRIGDRVFFDGELAPIELYPWAGASIIIGDDSYIGGGTSFEATSSITLGARTHLGGFCRLMDNHFHPVVGDRHVRPAPRPVVIEDDVVMEARTIVLAGARVERGARIDAGTVVKRSKRSDGGAEGQ